MVCSGNISIVTFTTDTGTYAGTNGPISIDGYGNLPNSCHFDPGATCEVELCDMDTLTLRTLSTDGWIFTITGDIGDLLDYEEGQVGGHVDPFPTYLGFGWYDNWQTYDLLVVSGIVSPSVTEPKQPFALSNPCCRFFIDVSFFT